LEIIDEQKNDQQDLGGFVDNADRLQVKSVDYCDSRHKMAASAINCHFAGFVQSIDT
jgi:hypothetical protein